MSERGIMRRLLLNFLAAVLVGHFALDDAPVQQQPEKMARVGILSCGLAADSRNQARLATYRYGLRELGYVEGKNISFEPRFAENQIDRLPAHLATQPH